MQSNSKANIKISSVVMALVLLAGLVLSIGTGTPAVMAQDIDPTATPSDPSWLGFSAARDALEEFTGRDLTIVRSWEFYQDNWEAAHPQREDRATGIDSCSTAVHISDARPVYWGWTYRITEVRGQSHEVRVSFDLRAVVICDLLSTPPTPAPVPVSGTPVDVGDLPAPVAGAGATGSFELGGHVDGLTPNAITVMQSAGMTWVKKQLPISAGLGKAQEFIDAAHAAGFRILIGLVGDRDALAADFNGYVATYAAFAAQVAALGADAIEVWNEPNIDREWPVGQINGANYVQLLAPTYNAIRTANPSTMVISAAPAPTGFFGAAGCGTGGCNDDVFMQQMAQAGAAQYMDCVGLHYNEGIVSPGTSSGDPRGEYPTYYFGSMLNRGYAPFGGLPVCFTELGYLSGEGMGAPIPGGFAWASNTTVAQHAAWLADAAARGASSGRVRLMIIWNVNFTRWDSDPMGGYAIIRPDGSCPACSPLGTVMGG